MDVKKYEARLGDMMETLKPSTKELTKYFLLSIGAIALGIGAYKEMDLKVKERIEDYLDE